MNAATSDQPGTPGSTGATDSITKLDAHLNQKPTRGALRGAKISALGTYVPPRVLTNADLEKMVETNDEWITTLHGHS